MSATKADPAQEHPEFVDKASVLPLFKAFDAAADEEAGRPAPVDFNESRARLSDLIDKLPQRAAIRDDHKARWIEKTLHSAAERMAIEMGGEENVTVGAVHSHVLWHVRRASGIGGSEAGTIVKHFRGKKGTFGDARKVAMEKLLIMSPQPSTEQMARGVRAEPWIQRMYHEKHKTSSHEADLKKLRGYRMDKYPASVGTPDDIIVHTCGPRAGQKGCIDYKAPSADVVEEYEEKGISEDYVCQVHHYGTLQLASGSKFDFMSLEVLDPRSFQILSFEVPFDKPLAREILHSIDLLWHAYIMNGILPVAPAPDELAVEDERLKAIATQAAMLKVLSDDLTKRQKDLLERISALGADWHGLATGKMSLEVASFNRGRDWDEEALLMLAEQVGQNVDQFRKVGKGKAAQKIDAEECITILQDLIAAAGEAENGAQIVEELVKLGGEGLPIAKKLDLDALAEALEAEGVSTLSAAKVRETFKLSAKKSGPEYERLSHLKDQMSELATGIEEMIVAQAPNILAGTLEEDSEDFDPAMDMA